MLVLFFTIHVSCPAQPISARKYLYKRLVKGMHLNLKANLHHQTLPNHEVKLVIHQIGSIPNWTSMTFIK